MDLSNNKMTGTLPTVIGKLTLLGENDVLPSPALQLYEKSYHKLSKDRLSLAENRDMGGPIPSEMGALKWMSAFRF